MAPRKTRAYADGGGVGPPRLPQLRGAAQGAQPWVPPPLPEPRIPAPQTAPPAAPVGRAKAVRRGGAGPDAGSPAPAAPGQPGAGYQRGGSVKRAVGGASRPARPGECGT
jgi:hypothetical protein